MKASKKDVENAILFFAKKFKQEESYKALLDVYSGTPKIIEMIVYEMFLQKFDQYNCNDEEYEQYILLFIYATELREIGWVTHEQK